VLKFCMSNPTRLLALKKHGPITVTHPHIVKWWDKKKNGKKKPKDYPYTSNVKVWWKCLKNHRIFTGISTKAKSTSKSGCEKCYNQLERSLNQRIEQLKKHGSLLDKNPLLAKELHEENNLNSSEIPMRYAKRLKWKCSKCGNIKSGTVFERHKGFNKFTGCNNHECENYNSRPDLALRNIETGMKKNGNLEKNYPKLLREWDYKKNKKLPSEYTRSSASKVWWVCSKKHSWEAKIANRTLGKTGCPDCTKVGFSKLEMRVFCELKHVFTNVTYHARVIAMEADIFLNDYSLVIEVDGYLSHFKAKKRKSDIKKNKKWKANKINTIRLRDQKLKRISKHDILLTKNELELKDLKKLLNSISKTIHLKKEHKKKISNYKESQKFKAESAYRLMVKTLPDPPAEASLSFNYPNLIKEWHPKKNGILQPSMFTMGSAQKVWWVCLKGHKPFEQRIDHRTYRNQGCPKCGYIKSGKTRKQNLLKKK